MEKRDDELYELASRLVEEMGYALVCVRDLVERGRRIFRFYIDHARGIAVGDCHTASKEIAYLLDASFDFEGPYVLEVSSPGLEHALRTEREYVYFVGRKARLVLRRPIEGRSVIEGTITAAGSGKVSMKPEDGPELTIPLTEVSRGRLTMPDPGRGDEST